MTRNLGWRTGREYKYRPNMFQDDWNRDFFSKSFYKIYSSIIMLKCIIF